MIKALLHIFSTFRPYPHLLFIRLKLRISFENKNGSFFLACLQLILTKLCQLEAGYFSIMSVIMTHCTRLPAAAREQQPLVRIETNQHIKTRSKIFYFFSPMCFNWQLGPWLMFWSNFICLFNTQFSFLQSRIWIYCESKCLHTHCQPRLAVSHSRADKIRVPSLLMG